MNKYNRMVISRNDPELKKASKVVYSQLELWNEGRNIVGFD